MTAVRVLVADASTDAAVSLATLLELSGFSTKVAYEGESALATADRWCPHVCITDIALDRLDGYELAQRLRTRKWSEQLLLIAYTGYTSPEGRARALAGGFDYYAVKPIEPDEFIRMISFGTSGFTRL